MQIKTVKAKLWEIACVYPTVKGLMNKRLIEPNEGKNGAPVTDVRKYGEVWASKLAALNPTHFANVCDDIADLKIPVPSPADQLPFVIAAEVKNRCNDDYERFKHYEEGVRARMIKQGNTEVRDMTTEQVMEAWRLQEQGS